MSDEQAPANADGPDNDNVRQLDLDRAFDVAAEHRSEDEGMSEAKIVLQTDERVARRMSDARRLVNIARPPLSTP